MCFELLELIENNLFYFKTKFIENNVDNGFFWPCR